MHAEDGVLGTAQIRGSHPASLRHGTTLGFNGVTEAKFAVRQSSEFPWVGFGTAEAVDDALLPPGREGNCRGEAEKPTGKSDERRQERYAHVRRGSVLECAQRQLPLSPASPLHGSAIIPDCCTPREGLTADGADEHGWKRTPPRGQTAGGITITRRTGGVGAATHLEAGPGPP
jgi:hypothetical protein